MSIKTLNNSLVNWKEFMAHIKDRRKHGDASILLPEGTENQSLRYNSSNALEATDSVLIYDGDGAKITDDHTVWTDERLPNLIRIGTGVTLPPASNYPIGTLCIQAVSGSSEWIQVAPVLDYNGITALITVGGKIYAGTSKSFVPPSGDIGGRLFRWEVDDNIWTQVADTPSGTVIVAVLPLGLVDLGGTIYALMEENSTDGSCVYYWNGTDAWVLAGESDDLVLICAHNAKIYVVAGAITGGDFTFSDRLYELSGGSFTLKSNDVESSLTCMVSYDSDDGLLYLGHNTGDLYRWDDVDTITKVADRYNSVVSSILHMIDTGMIWAINDNCQLLRFDDEDTWQLKADTPELDNITNISNLVAKDGYIWCSISSDSHPVLLKFDGVDTWEVVLNETNQYHFIKNITVLGDYIYGGHGYLYRADLTSTGESNIYVNIDDAWVKCVTNITYTENVLPRTNDTYYIGKNDDDAPLAYKGVILKDTANGKYYRIEVTNGSIIATDLTD